ncbi:NACHT, LRR and PYD domains-containing protein 12-like isoform X1 [Sardina pilchardus]|uniref:NACHT, LRR and PYD domains-containing protein 12-like isoform X1 n=1 Tax=Sardina pilchardus TaxID=27697 RepID=UPI002E12EE23
MDQPPKLSSGPPQSDMKSQKHRPVSPVPSCVSMKSDQSMDQPPKLSSGPPQSDMKSQKHRPVSPVPSCVSMKSDQSMDQPPKLSSGPPQSDINVGRIHLTEPAPVNRTELTDTHILKRTLMIHKASMKGRFETICEGIIRSGTQTLLNKIYTELYITEGESEGVNSEHEVWQVESASRPQSTEDIAINCNDIFKPLPGQKRYIRSVMTKGIAGIGKTVSVQKFILDWAEERANQDVDFMFVLPFRELNLVRDDQYSLHKLLLDFHPELRELQDSEFKDCRIVFIFDGLDESRLPLNFQENHELSDVTQTSSVDVLMTSLIQGTLLPSALIWITSRPAAASQIPFQCISQVTEVRGFNDPQKEEYFRKRISDQNQANRIISHIKASRSLHIMCHMPVFCWISATVLQQILEQDDGKEAPKTLTEMFIHFLLIQTTRKNQKYQEESETDRQKLLESHKGVILKLAELAYKHLENGNLMFYEEDLRECGIDVSEASMFSGMCTEIFREECVFHQKNVYCFVHLSIQEFLAALHLFASYLSKNMEVLKPFLSRRSRSLPNVPLDELLKNTVNKALESKNGHLDLFVRFLHGICLESNQRLLLGLLSHTHNSPESVKKTIKNLKLMQRPNISPERWINLFHCLVEMHDSSVHDEIQAFLRAEKGAVKQLSLVHCSALAHVLLMSDEVLDEFDLSKYKTSPERAKRLLPAMRCCRKALLSGCKLTETSCEIVASVLQYADSSLRELDLSQNDLQTSGEKLLSALQSPNCCLETLRLVGCKLTEDTGAHLLTAGLSSPNCKLQTLSLAGSKLTDKSCKVAAPALQSAISLKELDLSHNDLHEFGFQCLTAGLSSPNCMLTNLRLNLCHLSKASCEMMASVLQSAPSHLRELDMSDNDLHDEGVELLCVGLRDPQCKLETLRLVGCGLTEKSGGVLAFALQSVNSHLRELDLSKNALGDCGGKLGSGTLNPHCTMETLRLAGCKLSEKPCEVVASAVQHMVSLTELDLSDNHMNITGIQLLNAGMCSPNCKLQKLRLVGCGLTEKSGNILAFALQSVNSHLRQLDLSKNTLGDCGGKLGSGTLNPYCKMETLRLAGCKLSEKPCEVVASAVQHVVSLTELDLSGNHMNITAVQLLDAGICSPSCELQTLRLADCKLTEKSCEIVALALQSANSPLRELDLSQNDLQESGEKLLSALQSPKCKLETLRLVGCGLTEKSGGIVAFALQSVNSHLRDLDLSKNTLGDCGGKLGSEALNPHCKMETLRLAGCKLTEESCEVVASAVQHMVSLTELDLSDNHMNITAVQLLSAGISHSNCKLQILRLAGCKLPEESCEVVASAVQHMVSLTELDLSGNHLNIAGVHLSSALKGDIDCKLQILRHARGELRKYACELTLDPNTAHKKLSLSEGNRKVTCVSERQPYPDHPERFDIKVQVLCREGLTGRCYWEAELSGDTTDIAVAYKSIQRKGKSEDCAVGCNAKSWSLQCSGDGYSAYHNNNKTAIPAPSSRSSRVGVYLDWPAGTLSFYSVSSNTLTHLHTFHSTFTEPLYPGFMVWPDSSASLCQIT